LISEEDIVVTGIGMRASRIHGSDAIKIFYFTRTTEKWLEAEGDSGLATIVSSIPVEEFRSAWQLEVIKARDVMLESFGDLRSAVVDVLFDIRKGFHFAASCSRLPFEKEHMETLFELRTYLVIGKKLRSPLDNDDETWEAVGDYLGMSGQSMKETTLKIFSETP
jgi:hypothetical protein